MLPEGRSMIVLKGEEADAEHDPNHEGGVWTRLFHWDTVLPHWKHHTIAPIDGAVLGTAPPHLTLHLLRSDHVLYLLRRVESVAFVCDIAREGEGPSGAFRTDGKWTSIVSN